MKMRARSPSFLLLNRLQLRILRRLPSPANPITHHTDSDPDLRRILFHGADIAERRMDPTSINNPAVSTPAIHFLCRPEPMMAYTALGPARVPKPTAVLSRPVLDARFSDPNISATTTGKREMKPTVSQFDTALYLFHAAHRNPRRQRKQQRE